MQNDIIIQDLIKEIEHLKKEVAEAKAIAESARSQAYLARRGA